MNSPPQHVDLKYRISGTSHENSVATTSGKGDSGKENEKEINLPPSADEKDFVQVSPLVHFFYTQKSFIRIFRCFFRRIQEI